ncbi:MAG TPA: ABC transporter ATP-binding protein, partial [Trebonia sp.]|nr:ABC transporter ATP-binding protein [Trebonia sp.]
MYSLKGIKKDYPKGRGVVHALRGVDLEIADGEWLAIQGPTGHGKSTLLQILGGLDRPSAGVLDFDGRDLAKTREAEMTKIRASSIGFVFQTFNLIPTLSAQENVETALAPLGIPGKERKARAAEALESVSLSDRLRHLPSELSGGQQQRVAIARALVKAPKVLLADEPTGNLDEDTRDEIMGLMEEMWADKGLTMVIVTHDSAVARRAQRLGTMKNGQITIKQLAKPATRPAAAKPAPPASAASAAEADDSAEVAEPVNQPASLSLLAPRARPLPVGPGARLSRPAPGFPAWAGSGPGGPAPPLAGRARIAGAGNASAGAASAVILSALAQCRYRPSPTSRSASGEKIPVVEDFPRHGVENPPQPEFSHRKRCDSW